MPKYGFGKCIIFERMLNADEIQIIPTRDGSNTLFLAKMNETYHSRHGALREAMHVYLKMGLWRWVMRRQVMQREEGSVGETLEGSEVRVLELGFGTGMNAWLSRELSGLAGLSVWYTSLEQFPVPLGVLEKVELGFDRDWDLWEKWMGLKGDRPTAEMRRASWWDLARLPYGGGCVRFDAGFEIAKIQGDAIQFFHDFAQTGEKGYDVVFWDAFAPKKQPELWTEELFVAVKEAMQPGGLLVTYTANGEVRRRMQRAGFEVERPVGPPGKREMLCAIKPKM